MERRGKEREPERGGREGRMAGGGEVKGGESARMERSLEEERQEVAAEQDFTVNTNIPSLVGKWRASH